MLVRQIPEQAQFTYLPKALEQFPKVVPCSTTVKNKTGMGAQAQGRFYISAVTTVSSTQCCDSITGFLVGFLFDGLFGGFNRHTQFLKANHVTLQWSQAPGSLVL